MMRFKSLYGFVYVFCHFLMKFIVVSYLLCVNYEWHRGFLDEFVIVDLFFEAQH